MEKTHTHTYINKKKTQRKCVKHEDEEEKKRITLRQAYDILKLRLLCSNVTSFHILHSFILGSQRALQRVCGMDAGFVGGFLMLCDQFSYVVRFGLVRWCDGCVSRFCSLSTHISNIKEQFQFSSSFFFFGCCRCCCRCSTFFCRLASGDHGLDRWTLFCCIKNSDIETKAKQKITTE